MVSLPTLKDHYKTHHSTKVTGFSDLVADLGDNIGAGNTSVEELESAVDPNDAQAVNNLEESAIEQDEYEEGAPGDAMEPDDSIEADSGDAMKSDDFEEGDYGEALDPDDSKEGDCGDALEPDDSEEGVAD